MPIEQWLIMILGAAAIWLVGRKNFKYKRIGFFCGLISQPFWIYSSWKGHQWGIFILSVWYTYAWFDGLKNHWKVKE